MKLERFYVIHNIDNSLEIITPHSLFIVSSARDNILLKD